VESLHDRGEEGVVGRVWGEGVVVDAGHAGSIARVMKDRSREPSPSKRFRNRNRILN